jgi:putative PIN family toxin of toxin-antitoxin system
MRLVFDTNVLVSRLLIKNSLPDQAVEYGLDHGILLYSKEILNELISVLSRPKFEKYNKHHHVDQLIEIILKSWEPVKITQHIKACCDPKDDKFLELAVNGQANVIITGDEDLLSLHPFQNISIISPADFLKTEISR